MGTYEIYTIGGGYYLYNIFNFLAAFTAGTQFRLFMSIGITIGMASLMLRMMWGLGFRDIMVQFILMILVGLGGFGIKARVVIIDPTAGTIPIYGTVDNVPFAVAFLGNITSETGYHLTAQMEALLNVPGNMAYQKSGLMFGATLLSQASRWRAVSPKMHELLVNYTQNCVIDGTLLGHMDLETVANTGALEAEITANVPQSLAYYDPITGQTESCKERWTAVRQEINTEVDKVLAQKSAAMFQSRVATGGSNISKLRGTLSDFQSMIGMSSASAVATIRQAMLLNATDDAMKRFIAGSGNDAAMALYQAARTEVQTKSSYNATAASALKWVPLLKIVFEAMYYAAFPLALFMLLTPMGLQVLKGYAGAFVWLASWAPLSAILHYIVIDSAEGSYRSAGVISSDGTVNDVVLSLSNLYQMQAVENDVGATAGFLMMSIPFIASGLLWGASKMTGLATSMLNVGQGASIESGREAATGSISLGNTSMNMMQANKFNTSSLVDENRSTLFTSNGATVTMNKDGTMRLGRGSAISESGFSASTRNMVTAEMGRRYEEASSAAKTQTSELSEFISGAATETQGFVNSVTASKGTSDSGSVDQSGSSSAKVSQAWGVIQDWAKQNNVSEKVALEAAISGSAGLSTGVFGGSATARLTGEALNSDSLQLSQKASENQDVMRALDAIDTARVSSGWSSSGSQATSSEGAKRYSLDEGRRLAQSALQSISEAETAARTKSEINSMGFTADANINNLIADKLEERGYKAWQRLNSSDPADIALVNDITREVAGDLIDRMGAVTVPEELRTQGIETPTADFTAPTSRDSATIGGVEISNGAMRVQGNSAFATQQDHTNDRMMELNERQIQDSNTARGENSNISREVVQGSDDTLMGRLSAKVVNETAQLLGLSESQAEWMMKNDPRFQQDVGDATYYYWQNSAALKEASSAIPTSDLSRDSGSAAESVAPGKPPEEAPVDPFNPLGFSQLPASYTERDRDLMVRTIIGEAANQGIEGMAAVALVIKNRMDDSRYPDTPADVVLQEKQFSAWNGDGSGNDLVHKYGPGSKVYDNAAYAADLVMMGQIPDFTAGAVNYYSPAGMQALVDQGYQNNLIPGWLSKANSERDTDPVQVGGHIFTGQVKE
ncbi:conjugal transfer protein TraG N-terminal domain-containing protein (plasmid) [Gemmobacter fulvus]|uniref:Conjugal transfer protein TraG N-terminal domain-containing protein n=1 Tax=Gemmobacter fulvus TaxID=2840474 RepID=A0A975PC64_9RHOB|nr:conjugal transfer protein TraG N-terminal domain-containing protein [Gemmobacter fulvus]MBT9247963.1 conjugal transfer protein TraG N-terminal domain-containing protein [Gemmobacter fulvus]QWK93018.1 conjugal transfer protein TraG N-terminal domain-containing protein [Gemmobacter fulvus]